MAKLTIPKNSLPGIQAITELSDSEMNAIYDVMRKIQKGPSFPAFLKALSSEVKVEPIKQIANAIFSMNSLLLNTSFSLETIVNDVVDAFIDQSDEKTILSLDKELLRERLKFILLNGESIKLSYQAVELLTDSNKNILRESEFKVDIRMVFEDDFKVKNAVLLHNLSIISDSKSKQSKTTQFLLDRNDLQQLKAQIEAALINDENIRINNQGIINFIEVS